MKVVVLAGGTGAAKFVRGLARVIPAADITAIVNTGDDLTWWGLHVSPDLDTITYELAGLLDTERGWGRSDETFACRDAMAALGRESWFSLGDRDLATHLYRTEQMRSGLPLSTVTANLCRQLGVAANVLPMSNDAVRTLIAMDDGEVPFQEFFVHRRHTGAVHGVRFSGAAAAEPAPGVLEAIASADSIVIAPSNPVTSVGPILAVPGIVEALVSTAAQTAAISPIIGSVAFSGPAAALMGACALPVSCAGIALAYRPFLDVLLADAGDGEQQLAIESAGAKARFTDIRIRDAASAERLARETLNALV